MADKRAYIVVTDDPDGLTACPGALCHSTLNSRVLGAMGSASDHSIPKSDCSTDTGLPQPNETHLGGLVRFQAYLIIHTLWVRVKKFFSISSSVLIELYCFGVPDGGLVRLFHLSVVVFKLGSVI